VKTLLICFSSGSRQQKFPQLSQTNEIVTDSQNFVNTDTNCIFFNKHTVLQKLSYRKQITRQLHTNVEGIYNNNPVTLKYRLSFTQGRWKRNHSIDYTRLTISRVIWRWVLSWPSNMGIGHSKSLKVVPVESLDMVSYSPSIVTMAVSSSSSSSSSSEGLLVPLLQSRT